MIELLYRLDYLNIDKVILDNYYYLDLTEKEAVFLIKIITKIKNSEDFTISKILLETPLERLEVENTMANLYKKGFITISYNEINGEIKETYSIKETLEKIENSLDSRYSIKKITRLIEEGFGRTLSSKDILIVREFTYTFDEVRNAVSDCLKRGVTDVKYLQKVLESNAK